MFIRIFLALMLMFASSPAWAVTQWAKNSLPATGDNLTAWPAAVNAQWSIMDTLLSNYRKGYAITYSSASTVAVSAGEVMVSNSGGTIRIMLQDAASTNVTFANIDTGAEASATTYYLYCGTNSATAASCTFYLSTSASAPSGITYYKLLGSIYNNASSDIDANKIYTEPGGFPFTNSTGIDEAKLLAIYDYGTSASSSTRRNPSVYFVAHGVTTDGTAISNLPFTSASSYIVNCTMENAGPISQNVMITAKSASSFTCSDTLGNGYSIDWYAFGY